MEPGPELNRAPLPPVAPTHWASRWRKTCAPIIANVLAEHKDDSPEDLKRALNAVYPFGLRKHHPYRIWLDEIARQIGKKPPLDTRPAHVRRAAARAADPRQGQLFESA